MEATMQRTMTLAMLLIVATAPAALAADSWTADTAHSEVTFKIRHLMSKVTGRFDTFDATVTTDFENLARSSVRFEIDAASINTNNSDRDNHLRSPDFFDVANHPKITFESSKITKTGDSSFDVTGTLTMRGVAKQITIPVSFLGAAQDPWGNTKAGFELGTSLDRKDYGVSWNKALDTGGILLGDDVEIAVNLQVKKQ
jgi:polyisoprenoid-binding protein YceI